MGVGRALAGTRAAGGALEEEATHRARVRRQGRAAATSAARQAAAAWSSTPLT
jgi:hypothetical protein